MLNASGQKYPVSVSPYPVRVKQPDGSTLVVRGFGNESDPISVTEDGYTILKNDQGFFEYARPGKKGNLIASGFRARNSDNRSVTERQFLRNIPKGLRETVEGQYPPRYSVLKDEQIQQPGSGPMKLLVLLIRFPDLNKEFPETEFRDFMNKPGYKGTGSFRDFYLEASAGKFELNSDVFGWYVASHNSDYYGNKNGDERAGELVAEAIDAAEAAGVNFSVYDNNKDGKVDHLIVVHSGQGAEEGSLTDYIWSHTWSLYSSTRFYDDVGFDTYTILPETRDYGMVGIGVFCHEFCHYLRIPDLYDPFSFDGTSEGLGYWCLMASGSWLNHERTPSLPSAWVREKLGWITPVVIDAPGNFSLTPVSSGTQCFKLLTPKANEYFLLENRTKTGFDAALPGSGLAVYHVNTLMFNNFDENNKLVDLEEADGRTDLDDIINKGDTGDLFPGSSGNKSFNDLTNPNSQTYDEKISKIDIRDIEWSNDLVKFRIGSGFVVGNDLTFQSGGNTIKVVKSQVEASLVVKNTGNLKAGPFGIMLYLSVDDSITASDYKISEKSFQGMAPGTSANVSFSVDVSSVYPPVPVGKYYVGYMIDYQNSVEELDEKNNSYVFRSDPFDLKTFPNLTYSQAGNTLFVNGNEVEAILKIQNTGNTGAGKFRIGFFLSKSYPVAETSYKVGEEVFTGIASGEFITTGFKANLESQMNQLPLGEYYLGYIIDFDNSVDESVETDNAFTYLTRKISNIKLPNLTFDQGLNKLSISKTELSLNLSVLNNGNMPSDSCIVGIYFSIDSTITVTDYLLSVCPVGPLGKGEVYSSKSIINLHSLNNVPAGKYYTGYLIDYKKAIDELSEDDNGFTFKDQFVQYSPVETVIINKSICQGSSFFFMDTEISDHGIYKFQRTGANGKDTLFIVNLTINPVQKTIINKTICPGDSIVLPTGVFKESGVHILPFTSHYGCDSIVYINLTLNVPGSTVLNKTICQGDTVIVGNSRYFEPGIYHDIIKNKFGCDSAVTLNLLVNSVSKTTISKTICEGSEIKIGNFSYNKSGTYKILLRNHSGCDSVVTLNLNINPVKRTTIDRSVCSGDSVQIGKFRYSATGVYHITFPAKSGCDSIVTLNLTVNQTDRTFIEKSVCRGDTVRIGRFRYYDTGIYTNTFSNKRGCDSVVVLDLRVSKTDTTRIGKVVCHGSVVKIGTKVYTATGLYRQTLTNKWGCDSVVILNLTVNPLKETRLERSICEGDSIKFGGKFYKTTGVYNSIFQVKNGCDSTVYLKLTVNPSYLVRINKKICKGSTYSFGNRILSATGTYTDSLTSRSGCDSIVVLSLEVINPPDVNLSANYTIFSSDILTLDAGTGFAGYVWSTGESSQQISIDATKGLGSKEYTVTVSDKYSCKSTAKLMVTIIDNSFVINDREPNLKVFPNPANGKISLLIEKIYGSFEVQIINANGQVVHSARDYSVGNHFIKKLDLSGFSKGYYLAKVISGNQTMTEKFIITGY